MTLLNVQKDRLLSFLSFDNLMSYEKQKLIDMGMVPGENLKVVQDNRCGFITVLLKGSKIALDYNLASKIIVKEVLQ